MKLKYSDCLSLIPNCPPTHALSVDRVAYRFVHETVAHEKSFVPPAILKPARVFPEDQRCDALALSMFTSRDNAIAVYTELVKIVKNIRKTIGSHLAEGNINATHGLATPVEGNGHFNLFAAESAEFTTCFSIAVELP